MLIQSTPERIGLLPALPAEWNEGSIAGLCVKGGLQLSMEWKKGLLVKCFFTSTSDVITKVIYRDN